jgi:hypothetical protein
MSDDFAKAIEASIDSERLRVKEVADMHEAMRKSKAEYDRQQEARALAEFERQRREKEFEDNLARAEMLLRQQRITEQAGLVNHGNACYMISSIQLLRAFVTAARATVPDPVLGNMLTDKRAAWTADEYKRLFTKFIKEHGSPNEAFGNQQDSNEFLQNVMKSIYGNQAVIDISSHCMEGKNDLSVVLSSLSTPRRSVDLEQDCYVQDYNNSYGTQARPGVQVIYTGSYPSRVPTPKWALQLVDPDMMFDIAGVLHVALGAVVHDGRTMNSGHYFYVGRDSPLDQTWTRYNDDVVTTGLSGTTTYKHHEGADVNNIKICAILICPAPAMAGGAKRIGFMPALRPGSVPAKRLGFMPAMCLAALTVAMAFVQ